MQLSMGLIAGSSLEDYLSLMLRQIAACEVANRPGRLEPRVLKRRRHGYKLMQKSRAKLRAELRKSCT
jgi:putative transposase